MDCSDQGPPILFERPKLSLPVSEAASELGVSRQTLESIIKAGGIKCHTLRPGVGERRISYAELVRYVERREAVGMGGG